MQIRVCVAIDTNSQTKTIVVSDSNSKTKIFDALGKLYLTTFDALGKAH